MTVHSVASIEDAVVLAERFRRQGRYDLFRGQREDWPVLATLARLDRAGVSGAERRMQRFFGWVEAQPELHALADREDLALVDQKYAIAQHYGLPTLFCDFTVDPRIAAYFAGTPAAARGAGDSVIVCCNSAHFEAWTRRCFDGSTPRPEVLRPSFPDLWRMQAQGGVFLFLPLQDVESHYLFDRIVFPSAPFDDIDVADVYPKRRSRLEMLLDQYFGYEREVEHHEAVVAIPNLHATVMPGPEALMRDVLSAGDPGPHPSWLAAAPTWRVRPQEPWRSDRQAPVLHLLDDLEVTAPRQVAAEVAGRVRGFLAAQPDGRRRPVVLTAGPPPMAGYVSRAQMLWDGLRALPCSDDELATAMGNLSGLAAAVVQLSDPVPHKSVSAQAVQRFWDDCMVVAFVRRGSAAAKGYVERAALRKAIRVDMQALLRPEHRNRARDPAGLLVGVPVPSRAFEFEAFASAFVTQVVPSQVVLFRSTAHYFSPMELDVFGHE